MAFIARSAMSCRVHLITLGVASAMLVVSSEVRAAEPNAPVRGVLVRHDRVTPEFLASWKLKEATAVVVPLDEATKTALGDNSQDRRTSGDDALALG